MDPLNLKEDDLSLNDFLSKVDEIDKIVKGMNTGDESEQNMALSKADKMLKETESEQTTSSINKTIINGTPTKQENPQGISQDAFMASVEADARERAQRRRLKTKQATQLKEQGNIEFKAGNFNKAVEYYTQGLDCLRDMVVLYTNRAQAYNKLGQYESAIEDCNTALRIEEKNTKAYIHKGNAHLSLLQYTKAIETYQEILKVNQKQEKLVNDYVKKARLAMEAAEAEQAASKVVADGEIQASNLLQLLNKLKQPDKPIIYYQGGLQLLAVQINNDTSKTLFRSNAGFELLFKKSYLSEKIQQAHTSQDKENLELARATVQVCIQATSKHDVNTKYLLELQGFHDFLLNSLQVATCAALKEECARFLFQLSQTSLARSTIISKLDISRLMLGLISCVQISQQGAENAMKSLNNLALEKQFLSLVRVEMKSNLLPAFEEILVHSEAVSEAVLPSCISTISNMAHDDHIRRQMSADKSFWQASLTILTKHCSKTNSEASESVLEPLLGLLMNLALEKCHAEHQLAPQLAVCVMPLLSSKNPQLILRVCGLLSRALVHSPTAVDYCVQHGIVDVMMNIIIQGNDDICEKYAVKCLTVLSQNNSEAQKQIIRKDKGLTRLVHLLDSEDDMMIANAALCIGHCAQEPGCSKNISTDVVQTLLTKTDTTNASIKQNCAITLAKLATTSPEHLKTLQGLGGIGILHSCMKYVDT
ncbi:tetratricopeptide repeat protein 12-like [Anneissia japonica]|uniref:tetratricopeptide repeat protein 12-like n=1 Tax=Anneissia japonica TaxID=1529436 RepID=UPI0014255AE0|nr:tetratricopeptide repeat protein 12-like [Anneissia japonica]